MSENEEELKKRMLKKISLCLQTDSNWNWEEIVGLVTDEAKQDFPQEKYIDGCYIYNTEEVRRWHEKWLGKFGDFSDSS